jgi:uncharacterized protein (DUF1330 family)
MEIVEPNSQCYEKVRVDYALLEREVADLREVAGGCPSCRASRTRLAHFGIGRRHVSIHKPFQDNFFTTILFQIARLASGPMLTFQNLQAAGHWEMTMNKNWAMAVSLVCGATLGAGAVQTIHAQSKGPAYTVAEIDVKDVEGYKQYSAKVQPVLKAGGARYVALAGAAADGPKIVAIDGTAPKRVAIHRWESMEKAMTAFKSAEYQEARKIGEKYATFRIFAVDGLPE